MIIWGSKGKETVVGRGNFYCPQCQNQRHYIHKEMGKYFTLYFIPLFRTSMLGEFIECQTCFTPFEKAVLNYENSVAKNAKKLIDVIQDEIESGIPLQVTFKSLLDSGVSKDAANTAISMATKGQMKICKSCEAVFTASLNFCSLCGKSLEYTK
ncbi:MAG: zinc-ribbon domain-containing protein [Anaerolineales bacterium]|nr:zinc-ribbon domain-containing protein [bacterium]MBL6982258.1 zinc-ribbon domain-containing protein [Anaerolineales bacterium]